ncbi:unnamed protein product [Echinostoma caproni]|uniref:Cilia- and flagella-associated protein 126 n=1 Tax=Echinostoma caproni TaxID=27848 RepID=A0A183B8W6_9TREM|nr:unnamed protein product [Echinostoma caproni]
MSQDSITSDIQSNMVVIAGLGHRIAFFVPPTSDNTPSLFASPLPWTKEVEKKGSTLGWKPAKFRLEDWTEPEDVQMALSQRRTQPMGTAYQPKGDYPPPDPVTGAPRNPVGRTGVPGRGHLPYWGANPSMILVATRTENKGKTGRPQILFAMFNHRIGGQLPWCLIRHSNTCPGIECTKNLVDMLVNARVTECIRANPEKRALFEQARSHYQQCKFRKVSFLSCPPPFSVPDRGTGWRGFSNSLSVLIRIHG